MSNEEAKTILEKRKECRQYICRQRGSCDECELHVEDNELDEAINVAVKALDEKVLEEKRKAIESYCRAHQNTSCIIDQEWICRHNCCDGKIIATDTWTKDTIEKIYNLCNSKTDACAVKKDCAASSNEDDLAHTFAMELCMPKVLFYTKYKEFIKKYSDKEKVYSELAEYFGVPVCAVEERIMELKILAPRG